VERLELIVQAMDNAGDKYLVVQVVLTEKVKPDQDLVLDL